MKGVQSVFHMVLNMADVECLMGNNNMLLSPFIV